MAMPGSAGAKRSPGTADSRISWQALARQTAGRRGAEDGGRWRRWANGQTRAAERICTSLDSQTGLLDHAAARRDEAVDRSRQRQEEIMGALARVARETGAGRE